MADLNMAAPDVQLPLNASEQRGSAHFQEISYKYYMGMSKIFGEKYAQFAEERRKLSPKDKVMTYALPSYRYVERKDV